MITISTPSYEIVTVNGKDYVIFYPQFLKNGDWATVGDENPLPVKIVELDTVKFWTEQLLETSEKNKEKLEQLNELISEMSMLSKGPKGDTRYMWIKYADDEKGTGMSDDPNDKKYIGMAFNKDVETPSDDPKDYVWTKYVADFEGIEIGGRNLLPSSYDLYNLGGSYGYIKLSDSPTIVKIYDKDVDVDIDGVYFGLTNNGTNSSGGYRWIVNGGNIDNEYYSGVINDYPYFSFFPKTREVFNKIFRRFNIKIERGTIPTDWSPALEDINKDFVGLSNVQNYGIALESQAKAGVSNAVYMTPLRTKQAIEALNDVEVTNTPYGKCVKHPDGTLEHFAFGVVMDRHISSSYKRADVDFTIPFIDENYYVSSSIVTGLSKNPLPYTRTKGTDSVEMAVGSMSTDFNEEDEVTIDLHAVGRWK